jgi:hypothetical protein
MIALIALAFFVALVVIVFTALAVAVCWCLLSAAITRSPEETLLPLVALYFIMADCYIAASAPMPSSHYCSRHHCCHCIVIVSCPATLTEESVLKKKKAGKVFFSFSAQK